MKMYNGPKLIFLCSVEHTAYWEMTQQEFSACLSDCCLNPAAKMPGLCLVPIMHGEFPGRCFSDARNNRVIQKEHRWLQYSLLPLICQSGRHILPSLCCTVPPCMIISCCIGILLCQGSGAEPEALSFIHKAIVENGREIYSLFAYFNMQMHNSGNISEQIFISPKILDSMFYCQTKQVKTAL